MEHIGDVQSMICSRVVCRARGAAAAARGRPIFSKEVSQRETWISKLSETSAPASSSPPSTPMGGSAMSSTTSSSAKHPGSSRRTPTVSARNGRHNSASACPAPYRGPTPRPSAGFGTRRGPPPPAPATLVRPQTHLPPRRRPLPHPPLTHARPLPEPRAQHPFVSCVAHPTPSSNLLPLRRPRRRTAPCPARPLTNPPIPPSTPLALPAQT